MKSLKQLLLAALVAGTIQIASALPYTAGDLLLVFRDATTNNRPNVEFNLGPVGNFLDQPAGVPIAVGFDTNAVYTNAFGSSLANVKISAVAATASGASQPRVWLTDANLVTAPSDYTVSKFSVVRSKVDAVGVQNGAITGTNSIPLIISPTAVGSYSYIVSPGNSAAVGTFNGDTGFTVDAANGNSLTFYQIVASAVTPKPLAIKVGTFDYATDGTVTFTPVAVTPVLTSPSVALQTATVNAGTSKTFSVTADGACGYQWYLNGSVIGGATSSSYTIANPVWADAGNYTVVASNCVYGTTTTSSAATLTVVDPYITTNPAALTVARGAGATFTVAATGSGLSYQWYLNGAAIVGATSASYNIPSVGFADLGNYSVTVSSSNSGSTVTSSNALLKFTGATAYLAGDLQLIFRDGTTNNRPNVEFNLGTVSNYLNLTAGTVVPVSYNTNTVYTNAFGGSLTNVKFAVAAANSSMLWLSDANLAGAPLDPTVSKFSVQRGKIDNAGVQAAAITLGVNPLVISPASAASWSAIVSPGNSTAVGTLGGDAAFTVDAANGNSLDLYQVVPSAATPKPASIKIGRFTYAADGSITFTASAVTPVITSPTLANQTITVPSSATFSVTSDGASNYQWYRNGAVIPGATASSYTASGARFADNGSYFSVVVSNATYGTSASSGNATLTVIDPNPFTTQPASVSVKATSNATFSVVLPGTPLTYQWKQNGTNAPFPGAQTATLTVTNTKTAWNGYLYSVIVSNSLGQSVTSAVATLGVTTTGLSIAITAPPASLTKNKGQVAIFSVTAVGTAPFTNLTYQWKLNGSDLAGANARTYTNVSVNTGDAGSYTVAVSNAVGGILSAAATLTVNDETNLPTVTITAPVAGATIFSGTSNLVGTAKDTGGRVSQVLVSLNGGAFTPAMLSITNILPENASWSYPMTLAVGTNNVAVKTVDFAGNETAPVVTRSFFYAVPSALTVNVVGTGLVNNSNQVASLGGTNIYVNRRYTLTALPSSTNWLFSNWVNTATSEILNVNTVTNKKNSYTFLMETNLTLTANFVTNRFIAAAGYYYALFSETNGAAEKSAGYLTVKTDYKQVFSGSIFVDGTKTSISGSFDLAGVGTPKKAVIRKGKPTLTVSLQLNFDDTIGGTVSCADEGWTAPIGGDRAVFNPLTNPATNVFAPKYTLLIPGGLDAATAPVGYGYSKVTLGLDGTVKNAGALADGDKFAPFKTSVSKNGDVAIYSPQYKVAFDTGTNGVIISYNGCLIGWLHIDPTNAVITGNLEWIKTGWTNGYYDAGFTNTSAAAGSVYTTGVSGVRHISITNGVAAFTAGNLAATQNLNVGIDDVNKFTFATNGVTVKAALAGFTASSGLVSGTFTNVTTGVKTKYTGVYLPQQNLIGAAFKGTNQTGGILIQ